MRTALDVSPITEQDLTRGILQLEEMSQAEYDEYVDRHVAGRYVWDKPSLAKAIRSANNYSRKVTDNSRIIGFTIATFLKSRVQIVRFAYTLEEAADELLYSIKIQAAARKRVCLYMYVQDSHLLLQQYLALRQFKAVKIEGEFYLFEHMLTPSL